MKETIKKEIEVTEKRLLELTKEIYDKTYNQQPIEWLEINELSERLLATSTSLCTGLYIYNLKESSQDEDI